MIFIMITKTLNNVTSVPAYTIHNMAIPDLPKIVTSRSAVGNIPTKFAFFYAFLF